MMIVKSPDQDSLNQTALDPGPPPRKPRSGLKFFAAAACVIFFVLLGRSVYGIWNGVYEIARFGHRGVWQNQTIEEFRATDLSGDGMSRVVQPLISEEQTFDIAVTVWQLRSEEERKAFGKGDRNGEGIPGETVLDATTKDFLRFYTQQDKLEKAIYSDIVFRGLRLSDKNVHVDIQLRIGTEVFRREPMETRDLRASFVLIPTSPSLMNHLHSYTSWYPDGVIHPRYRAYPFPLDSTTHSPRTEVDRALESFAISIPLLHLVDVGDCQHKNKIGDSESMDSNGDSMDEDDEDDDTDYTPPSAFKGSEIDLNTKRKHPFVITRTQIRVVDETHLFNRKAYDKLHRKLKKTSCGQGQGFGPPYRLCQRKYADNGNWETRLTLKVPTELKVSLEDGELKLPADSGDGLEKIPMEDGSTQTQYAYAPYMASFAGHLSPKDLVRVPVVRQNCTSIKAASGGGTTGGPEDEEYMNLTWHLSYSGRSPGKLFVGELVDVKPKNYTTSEYQKGIDHEMSELWNGLFGHRYNEETHPRRRLFLGIFAATLGFIISLLEIHYWYTCTSTVSISIHGTTMSALGDILKMCVGISRTVAKDKISGVPSWVWLLSKRCLTDLLAPFLMLRAVSRIELNGWSIKFIGASHAERTSHRLDSRMSRTARLSLFFTFLTLYFKLKPFNLFIIESILPLPTEEDQPTTRLIPLISALQLTGAISQIVLNSRAKVFAGSYKTTVWLKALQQVNTLVFFVPEIVGRYDARGGLSVGYLCRVALAAVGVWQAVSLPRRVVPNGVEEEK
ncbi:hypothetical protein C8J56DRAFT_1026641 [Mycena floridula]|nr:hypothetical protein C8J56DRAFT_1026641 [Mycena floridula]